MNRLVEERSFCLFCKGELLEDERLAHDECIILIAQQFNSEDRLRLQLEAKQNNNCKYLIGIRNPRQCNFKGHLTCQSCHKKYCGYHYYKYKQKCMNCANREFLSKRVVIHG